MTNKYHSIDFVLIYENTLSLLHLKHEVLKHAIQKRDPRLPSIGEINHWLLQEATRNFNAYATAINNYHMWNGKL